MKIFFWGIFILLYTCSTKAQTISPGFYKELVFTRSRYTLYELSATIAAQSGLSVSFNAQKLNPHKSIRIRTSRATVARVMQLLQRSIGVKHTIVQGNIILLPPTKNAWYIIRRRSVANHRVNSAPSPIKVIPRQSFNIQSENQIKTVLTGDTLRIEPGGADSNIVVPASGGGGGSSAGGSGGKWIDPYQSLNNDNGLRRYDGVVERSKGFINEHGFGNVSAGITESFYGNPTISMGFDFLHVSIGYYFHPDFSHFRYGVGGNMRINERWQMNLAVSGGARFDRAINVPYKDTLPWIDTSQPRVIVDRNQAIKLLSKLIRISVAMSYHFSPRLNVAAGIHLNLLNTQYYLDDNQILPASLRGIPNEPGDDFRTLKIPYYLSDNFNVQRAEDRKIWLGLNLSINYRLF